MTRIHTDLSRLPISAAPSPATSGTTLGVTDANAAFLPDTYPYWAVLVPTGSAPTRANSEIVKVTGGSSSAGTTTLTIVRAQGVPVTTAQTVTTSFDIYDAASAEAIPTISPLITAAPSADHSASGITIQLAATATSNFGDVGYIASTGKVTFIDADAIASMSGIVMCADAQIAANATGNWLLLGVARDDTWNWTVGGLIYGTVTATTGNTLSQTAPTGTDDVVQILGVALSADTMLFRPSLSQVELV